MNQQQFLTSTYRSVLEAKHGLFGSLKEKSFDLKNAKSAFTVFELAAGLDKPSPLMQSLSMIPEEQLIVLKNKILEAHYENV